MATPTISPTKSFAPTFFPTESLMPTQFPAEPQIVTLAPTSASPFTDNTPNHQDNKMIIGAGIGSFLAIVLTAGFICIMVRRRSKHMAIKRNKNSRPLREISW